MPTAISSPNIALIKYWGNRNNALRLPKASSLSMVLDTPTVTITAEPSDVFTSQSFDGNGVEQPQSDKAVERLRVHWELVKQYLQERRRMDGVPQNVTLRIISHIPPAIGIASSAAVFSCLGEVYAGLVQGEPLSREDVGVLGRLGSGSAGRNSFSGFVALENISLEDTMGSCIPKHIAPKEHWNIHDIILVPSLDEKKVGSTEGHTMAHTSPLYESRIADIPRRMTECIDAIHAKDFEKMQCISELDSLDMHRVMETQDPPLHYLNTATHEILREVEALRKAEHLEVLYTMDAGPTVHLLCTDAALPSIRAYAKTKTECTLFESKIGSGSHIIRNEQ